MLKQITKELGIPSIETDYKRHIRNKSSIRFVRLMTLKILIDTNSLTIRVEGWVKRGTDN
ncbi:hypothetical protein LCER1_G009244 [Lachnellula cervina]|uniref:Uncharacterized protein n=1 Tax=Lachnellula cervina TaxID=1316786 RepID=A0A7D8YH61_9HELO|nr:hypothetical protein LCER1_G009244 [Lachnellula cervina]